MLSVQTYKKYQKSGDLNERKEFLRDWFGGKDSGGKKVDSAIRIFDSDKTITFPEYLIKAVQFDT